MIFFIPCGCFAVSNAQRYYHLNPKNNIMEAVIGLDFSSSFFTSSKHTSRLSSTVSDSKFPVAQPDRFEPLIFSFFLCQCHVVDKRSRSICVFFMLRWFITLNIKKIIHSVMDDHILLEILLLSAYTSPWTGFFWIDFGCTA
jgi:hypothetical protein